MNKVWYRQLGFHNNPFSIKPAAFHDHLFGYEDLVARVIKTIDKGNFVFVEGEYGEGKTTILKHLIRYFGGHKKVIYFSANRVENRVQVRRLLNERYGRIGKWFDMRPKDMVLLLDEVQDLDKRDVEKLLKFRKEGNFKSVVFVGQQYNEESFPESVVKVMKHFKLEKMTEDDAVKLVRRRVGQLPMLPDETIKTIFVNSNNNARALLKNCELLCKKAVDYGSEKITDKMLSDIFGTVMEEPAEEKIFLEIEEDEKEVVEETEVEEEKPKEELEEDWEDVAVEEKEEENSEEEKKDFEFEDEIDEELAKMDLEEEEERKVKMANGVQKAVAAEEALSKSTDELLDEHYY